jgi:hypothetical protein
MLLLLLLLLLLLRNPCRRQRLRMLNIDSTDCLPDTTLLLV